MNERIFQNFTVDLNENFLKEFDKISERVKIQKILAELFNDLFIYDGLLEDHLLSDQNLINKVTKNDLINGFKLALDKYGSSISYLKREDNE